MSAELQNHPYAKTIWNRLMANIGNEKGVAGLMGNLQAESGLYPDRVQGDIPYSEYSKSYTAKVDNGSISENDFVNNGPNGGGYGLAQWTFYTRKQALYDMYKSGNYSSIGSVELACDYLLKELQDSYTTVYLTLRSAKTVQEASDRVLHDFENPADQSVSVEGKRAAMGEEILSTFTGSSVTPSTPTKPKKKMSKLLLYLLATDDL